MTNTITLSGGALGNTTLTLHTDSDLRAIEFATEQRCITVVSDWINNAPDIQTNVWLKKKESVTYVIRQTDVEFAALLTCIESHGIVLLNDSIHTYVDEQVVIAKIEGAYDAHTSWAYPWLITLELKRTLHTGAP